MSEPRVHLVVGTPCYGGQVASLYTTSLLKLQHACDRRSGMDLTVHLLSGDALIPRARQDIAAQFLTDPTTTHLLFIDGDIGFEPSQVFRLLDFNVPMAAAVYPTKRIDWEKARAAAKAGRASLEKEALSYVLEFEDLKKAAYRDGFARVRFAGTGFLMIRRDVLVSMLEKYPELRYRSENRAEDTLRDSPWRAALFNCILDTETGTYLSEDFSFCRRWTDMGGEIWVDLQSRLVHVGSMNFNGDITALFPNV